MPACWYWVSGRSASSASAAESASRSPGVRRYADAGSFAGRRRTGSPRNCSSIRRIRPRFCSARPWACRRKTSARLKAACTAQRWHEGGYGKIQAGIAAIQLHVLLLPHRQAHRVLDSVITLDLPRRGGPRGPAGKADRLVGDGVGDCRTAGHHRHRGQPCDRSSHHVVRSCWTRGSSAHGRFGHCMS